MKKLFSRNGVSARIQWARGSDLERLGFLKSLVQNGIPVPVFVLSGIGPHWVVVCGYDDVDQSFFIWDDDGDVRITHDELLSAWSMPLWSGIVRWWRYLFIELVPR